MARILRAVLGRCHRQANLARARWAAISHVGTSIRAGVQFDKSVLIQVTDGGVLQIGRGATFGRGVTLIAKGGALIVGERSQVGPWSTLVARGDVEIGDDCLIAERVSIRDQDHEIDRDALIPIRLAGMRTASIRIGNDVWIGAGAIILRGVTIGHGAVVAANAVVTRDVGPRVIVAGVPARLLRERERGA